MQQARDSFYIALRDRLAVINPARTMTIRGLERPSILVEDAEAPVPQMPNDLFVLRWTSMVTQTQLPSILVLMTCEIHYASSGSEQNGGLDRGRALAKMDEELAEMLSPFRTPKMDYTHTPATTMQTMVFWSEPDYGAVKTSRDLLQRIATVTVFAFEEQGG